MGWREVPLKAVAEIRVSNVDKKSLDGEVPVRLCNYTDVYYHDRITSDVAFMNATAGPSQIRTFGLRSGDVLLTKDSETASDIGVAAFVPDDLPGVLCGYHLAMLRPTSEVEPLFLYWAIRSQQSRDQLSVGATGVTRFGLRTEALASLRVPIPSRQHQRRIVTYLDAEGARIDGLIEKKRRLSAMVELRWRVAVRHAMQSLGERNGWIPLKRVVQCLDGRRVPLSGEERSGRQGDIPYFGASGTIDHVDDWIFDERLVLLGEDGAQLGDPDCEISFVIEGKAWVNNHAHVLRPTGYDAHLLALFLSCMERGLLISGATREKLTQGDMANAQMPDLALDVQSEVSVNLRRSRDGARQVVERLNRQIELLQEHKQALITAAVTGELDIPGIAA